MEATVKGESSVSQFNSAAEVSGGDAKITTSSPGLSVTVGDRWFNQLPVVTSRSQFTGHNLCLWTCYFQAILRPRNLMDHLTDSAPPQTDPSYKCWTVEEEILYIWILDSMRTELANQFIEYETVKKSGMRYTNITSRKMIDRRLLSWFIEAVHFIKVRNRLDLRK